MFPLTIRHSKIKPLISPFILLLIVIILRFTGVTFTGLIIHSTFFIFFAIKGVQSFRENIIMQSEKICFYENKRKLSSIKYQEISKLDLYIDTNSKNTTTYICIYKNSKNGEKAKIDFSDFIRADLRKIIELILKQNPMVYITPKLTNYL